MKKYIIAENDVQGYGNGVSSVDLYTDKEDAKNRLHCLMNKGRAEYGGDGEETEDYGYIPNMYYVDIFEEEDDSIAREDVADIVSWIEDNFTKDGLQEKQDVELRKIIRVVYDRLQEILGGDDYIKDRILSKMLACRNSEGTFTKKEIEWFKNK